MIQHCLQLVFSSFHRCWNHVKSPDVDANCQPRWSEEISSGLVSSIPVLMLSHVISCYLMLSHVISCSCSPSLHLHFIHWLELVTESRPNPYILQEFRMSKLDAVEISKHPDLWLGRQAHILYCLGYFRASSQDGPVINVFSSHLFTIWYLGRGFYNMT